MAPPFFWQLTNDQISFFVIGSFSGYLFAAFVVKPLHRKFDKRRTGMFALLLYTVGPAMIFSALADIADENELKHGMRQAGILCSTRTFFRASTRRWARRWPAGC